MDTRPAELRLLENRGDLASGQVLCNTVGRAQLARKLAAREGTTFVHCFFFDLFQLQQARFAEDFLPPQLTFSCEADLPAGTFDLVALCFSRSGDAELARDLLQAGHERLAPAGQMAISVENAGDNWFHDQLQGLFGKITRRTYPDATVYLATRPKPQKKRKSYASEFSYRDGERVIHLRTRPGVFSHREVDNGARALMKVMSIAPAAQVLDLGCGSGVVGITAALRAPDAGVLATDSNPRAIEAAQWGAEHSGAANLTASLDCDGSTVPRGSFDLVLTNPPYYSNFRIAGVFVGIAQRSLRAGGELLVVTKTPDWYFKALETGFVEIEAIRAGNYQVVRGRRKPT
ncbi:MAG: class I SAM-dependent methyltransferase [Pirellulaceae bacterium]|jgi:16S rRNA (guanine1207-N2)-methyltransferase|nr:class I SAM-dependent methyltransferase [Pirellulaceae bacterium]